MSERRCGLCALFASCGDVSPDDTPEELFCMEFTRATPGDKVVKPEVEVPPAPPTPPKPTEEPTVPSMPEPPAPPKSKKEEVEVPEPPTPPKRKKEEIEVPEPPTPPKRKKEEAPTTPTIPDELPPPPPPAPSQEAEDEVDESQYTDNPIIEHANPVDDFYDRAKMFKERHDAGEEIPVAALIAEIDEADTQPELKNATKGNKKKVTEALKILNSIKDAQIEDETPDEAPKTETLLEPNDPPKEKLGTCRRRGRRKREEVQEESTDVVEQFDIVILELLKKASDAEADFSVVDKLSQIIQLRRLYMGLGIE